MLKNLANSQRFLRKLLFLGAFDERGFFRVNRDGDAEEAAKLISQLAFEIEDVEGEWKHHHLTISDLSSDQLVRVISPDQHEFFRNELQPSIQGIITTEIANRLRYVRAKYRTMVNIQPEDRTLKGEMPADPRRRAEIGVLLSLILGALEEIEMLAGDFGDAAAAAFEIADPDHWIKDSLMARRTELEGSIPADLWLPDDEVLDSLDSADLNSTLLQSKFVLEFYDAHKGPFSYYFLRELVGSDDLGQEHLASRETADFLTTLLDDWTDRVEGGYGSFTQSEVEKRKRALAELHFLASHPEVFALLRKQFFDPKEWLDNLSVLPPIVLDRASLNAAARNMLQQVYSSFVFGQWSAVFALSRAAVEYAVKERARSRGIDILEAQTSPRSRGREKSLDALVEELVTAVPELLELVGDLDEIRKQGNKALHKVEKIKAQEFVDAQQRFRKSAIDVILRLKKVLEALYRTG